MAQPTTCPACRQLLRQPAPARCPECGAAIGDAPRRRIKKKKPQAAGLSKKHLAWIAGGAAALTLLVCAGGIVMIVMLARGGRVGSSPFGSSGSFAVVDELPDPPPDTEPPEAPEPPEAKPPQRMIWTAKPDPPSKPIDYSNAFGGPTPDQFLLRAALDGPFVIGIQMFSDPAKRTKNAKTGDPAHPYKLVPQADAPYPVVDIRTGKEVGSFPAAARLESRSRLGPDGQFAASWETVVDKSSRDHARSDFLAVWKRGGDKPITRWPVPARVLWFDFVGPDRVALYLTDGAPRFVILDVVKGTEVASTPLPASEFPPQDISRRPRSRAPFFQDVRAVPGAVSPGGAYAVIPGRTSMLVLSTADGSVAGSLPLGENADISDFWGTGFDESGSEFRAGFKFTIRAWSMRDGQTRHSVTLKSQRPRDCRIVSGPDPDTLIYGNTVVDLASGKPIYGLPVGPLQWIKPDLVLAIANWTQPVNAKAVQDSVDYLIGIGIFVTKFPRDEYQKAAAPILAAREKSPAAAPVAAALDRTGVVKIRPNRGVAWTVKPSGAPPLPAGAALEKWPDLFAANEGAGFLETHNWTRYDLKTGKAIGEPIQLWPKVSIPIEQRRGRDIELKRGAYAALSLDGQRVAVVNPADPARVGVWDSTGKQLIQFSPCTNQTIDWLGWSADGRLLAACHDLTTGWDVATGKAIFEIGSTYKFWNLAPGAAWFAAAAPGGSVDFFDASSGKQLGHIRGVTKGRQFLISPDGKNLVFPEQVAQAVAVPMQVWDLETGKRSAFESPRGPVFGQFIGPRHAISAPASSSPEQRYLLYDFDLHTHTYWFDPPKAPAFRNDSLGRSWMKKFNEKVWKPVKISGLDRFTDELAFGPGSIIRLEVDVGQGDYSQRIAMQTARQLQKNGFKIGRNGWVLRAEHKIGQSRVQLNNPVTGAKVPNSFISLDVTWRLLAPDGAEVWHNESSFSFDPFRSKYVVVGSRTNPGPQGGIQTVNLDFGGKNARTAQIEELLEQSLLFPQYLPAMPMRVAKTADGFAPLPLQAKWE